MTKNPISPFILLRSIKGAGYACKQQNLKLSVKKKHGRTFARFNFPVFENESLKSLLYSFEVFFKNKHV